MPDPTSSAADVVWRDRRRTFFGLPLSFTVYELDASRLRIRTGFLHRRYDEVRLYRVLDVSCDVALRERVFGIGRVPLHTNDASMGDFALGPVKDPLRVKELLADAVQAERDRRGMRVGEFVGGAEGVGGMWR